MSEKEKVITVTLMRSDLYDTPDGVRFGEMTLYDQSGFADDFSFEGDLELGRFLRLPDKTTENTVA